MSEGNKPRDFDDAEAFIHDLVTREDVTIERETTETICFEDGEPHISAAMQVYHHEPRNQPRFSIQLDVGLRNAQLIVQFLRTLDKHADDPDYPGQDETELPSMKPPVPAHKAN